MKSGSDHSSLELQSRLDAIYLLARRASLVRPDLPREVLTDWLLGGVPDLPDLEIAEVLEGVESLPVILDPNYSPIGFLVDQTEYPYGLILPGWVNPVRPPIYSIRERQWNLLMDWTKRRQVALAVLYPVG